MPPIDLLHANLHWVQKNKLDLLFQEKAKMLLKKAILEKLPRIKIDNCIRRCHREGLSSKDLYRYSLAPELPRTIKDIYLDLLNKDIEEATSHNKPEHYIQKIKNKLKEIESY